MLPHVNTFLRTKLLCLSQRYLLLFTYTHAKFERVEALLKGQTVKDSYLKVLFHTTISINDLKTEQCLKNYRST